MALRNRLYGSLLVTACAACQPSPGDRSAYRSELVGPLRGAGGAAMLPMIDGAAKAFSGAHPKVLAEITEARSSAATLKLLSGAIEFAFMSRPVRAVDFEDGHRKGKELHMVVVAAEAVAVIVHPSNPIKNATAEQLRGIFFAGSVGDWSSLTGGVKRGPIKVVAVNPKTSGTGELFASTLTGGDGSHYLPVAVLVDFSDETVARVAADPDAISFTGMGSANGTVRVIHINGVAPIEKNILDTSYVLNRKLFVVTDGLPKGTTREFVKFLLSEAGQRVAREKGFTPIVLD